MSTNSGPASGFLHQVSNIYLGQANHMKMGWSTPTTTLSFSSNRDVNATFPQSSVNSWMDSKDRGDVLLILCPSHTNTRVIIKPSKSSGLMGIQLGGATPSLLFQERVIRGMTFPSLPEAPLLSVSSRSYHRYQWDTSFRNLCNQKSHLRLAPEGSWSNHGAADRTCDPNGRPIL